MGEAGEWNDRCRIKAYFDLGLSPVRMFGRGLKLWLRAELGAIVLRSKDALRSAGGKLGRERSTSMPNPAAAVAPLTHEA
jgi:hypothetical protein